jgi:RNA polymerase sigma factor (sigma-70 family)
MTVPCIRDFERVVLPHLDAAYNLARWLVRDPTLAEDVVQDAALRALRYFASFRGGDGRAWILRIVRNTTYEHLKRRSGRAEVALGDAMDQADDVAFGMGRARPRTRPGSAILWASRSGASDLRAGRTSDRAARMPCAVRAGAAVLHGHCADYAGTDRYGDVKTFARTISADADSTRSLSHGETECPGLMLRRSIGTNKFSRPRHLRHIGKHSKGAVSCSAGAHERRRHG